MRLDGGDYIAMGMLALLIFGVSLGYSPLITAILKAIF